MCRSPGTYLLRWRSIHRAISALPQFGHGRSTAKWTCSSRRVGIFASRWPWGWFAVPPVLVRQGLPRRAPHVGAALGLHGHVAVLSADEVGKELREHWPIAIGTQAGCQVGSLARDPSTRAILCACPACTPTGVPSVRARRASGSASIPRRRFGAC